MFCELEGFVNGQQFKKLYEINCEPLMKKYNLKKIELEVLYFLYSYEMYDTAKDIVNYKCLSKAHVSKAIEGLTGKHYVVACPGPDRRCVHLTLTSQAVPIIEEMNCIWSHMEECIYRDVSETEQMVFSEVMSKIIRNINIVLDEKI